MSRYILLIRLAFTACLASFLFTATAAGDVARFDILDVGQGDAILVTSPEGKTLLVDAGPSGQVVNLLSEQIGSGSAEISVSTFSGSVHIEKK